MREPRYPLPRVVSDMISTTTRPPLDALSGTVGGARLLYRFLDAIRVGVRCSRPRTRGRSCPAALAADCGRPARGPASRGSSHRFSGRSASAGFDNDPSAGSPTETLLRLLLPLNDKVQWTSRDVAGGEPPTSPRSEHFTGPFNR